VPDEPGDAAQEQADDDPRQDDGDADPERGASTVEQAAEYVAPVVVGP